jgi:hypothetical protein
VNFGFREALLFRFFFEGCCGLVGAVLLEVYNCAMGSREGEGGEDLLAKSLGGAVRRVRWVEIIWNVIKLRTLLL